MITIDWGNREGRKELTEEQAFETAVRFHQAGDLDRAEKLYRALTRQAPGNFQVARLLGVALLQRGDVAGAVDTLRSAVEMAPEEAAGHCNLGSALRARGDLAGARAAFEKAVALEPDLAEAHNNLGSIALLEGDMDGAAAAYRRAVEINPDAPIPRTNLAATLLKAGNTDDALEQARAAVALGPQLAAAKRLVALCLAAAQCRDEALQAFADLDSAGELDAESLHHYGALLDEAGRWDEALAVQQRALKLNPEHGGAVSDALFLGRRLCRWQGHGERLEQFRALLSAGAAGLKPFTLLSEWSTPAEQQKCARLWSRRFNTAEQRRPVSSDGEPITVGYLSSGFHQHPTACLTVELFERHRRGPFRWIGYSVGPDDGSALRRRLANAFDAFRDLRGKAYRAMVEAIRADGVDILVDLRGYGGGAVTEVLGARAAPIQVNWLAYPGTMGAAFMDYIVVDPHVAPKGVADHFDEAPVYLPHSYQPTDTTRDFSAHAVTRAECGLPDDGFVFCSFNNSYKISERVFDRWMAILRRVPGSVLWLLQGGPQSSLVSNLRAEARARDVDPSRLRFMAKKPHLEYLAHYRLADLFLDTLPYNAHTTASDALWAGCPVLTCIGETFAGRVASSLCHSTGLDDLVMESLDDYEEQAVALATSNRHQLEDATHRLRSRRKELPLFQTQRMARELEEAYRIMMERARAGNEPEAIRIETA